MAVFTAITPGEAREILARYELGDFISLRGIAAGIENTNYFLETSTGAWVLTVFERLSFSELPFYLELMRHLAARGLPVPQPQASRTGELMIEFRGKPLAIVPRLPGRDISTPTAHQCALVGEVLARMHLAAADFPLFQPNLRGIGWWKDTAPRLESFLPEETFELLADEVVFQDSFTRSATFDALPKGAVHADLFRDNALIENPGAADERVGGVIDFYFAGCTAWLFDLAVTMNDWCIDPASGRFDAERSQAMIEAYHAVRPLTDVERESWRSALRAAALRFWISRLFDLHLPRAAELLTPKDPAHFERILLLRRTTRELPWPAAA
ncbi:MAG: homoserine kinase [Burkholderiaceae bacterium]